MNKNCVICRKNKKQKGKNLCLSCERLNNKVEPHDVNCTCSDCWEWVRREKEGRRL